MMCNGETTLDIGPGSANCTPAFGMGGVGVMVGVRVARRYGVSVGLGVLVGKGNGLDVADGLYAKEVGLLMGGNGSVLGLGVKVEAKPSAVG